MEVLDLFSAAAGGWSLGMHRAGFTTIAACEVEAWRRALYAENNPHVRLYDDVRTLTADRLFADLGRLPAIVVGSPPCQDISSANTKGKGVEGERSGLYFDAIRIIDEVRPRWFALENSANLRTRGYDAVRAALEAIGYACWPFVVRAGDVGANHDRARAWVIGCDLTQVADVPSIGRAPRAGSTVGEGRTDERHEPSNDAGDPAQDGCGPGLSGRRAVAVEGLSLEACGNAQHAPRVGHESGRPWGHRPHGDGATHPGGAEVGLCPPNRGAALGGWAGWSLADLADHLRLDDGLSARLAGARIAVGDGKGQSAASLIVEAFGDAVIPQIPEAIGRAILRTEAALTAIYGAEARAA